MIGIILGSESDWETMLNCSEKLEELGVHHDMVVASAHRAPEKVTEHIKEWEKLGYKIIIAAAGMSAALPGVVASQTNLPVIGVPMKSDLMGIDSLLSIVQMPKGVPVACMSVGKHGAINAAMFAKRLLDVVVHEDQYGS
jgi:5-(carboxyamino)imidazole ribonucleotide mutase